MGQAHYIPMYPSEPSSCQEKTGEMDGIRGQPYYLSHKPEILALFDEHTQAWKPILADRYGGDFANVISEEARRWHEALIPEIPYIGGDENPMTRHLIRSTTSLALYRAMKARGKSASETGKILYDAVVEQVSHLPPLPPVCPEDLEQKREQAKKSEEHRYSGDWVWEFVEGDGIEFDYGYDFTECGTLKLYHAHGAGEFLPFYCYLDFVTYRTAGWGFARTLTLAEGYERCDFRFKKGGKTEKGWPPPFCG
jgi:hypothetical protein